MKGTSSIFFVWILTVLFAAQAMLGCAINPVTGKQELMFFSEEDEINFGNNLYPNALWGAEGGGGPYHDERLKAYLGGIVERTQRVSHRPNLPVSFEIQNSSVPNAWAIPGHVVITRGLLAALDNEAEFAFIMGHEMGHVSARHSARQMSEGILLGVGLAAAGLALGDTEGSDVILGLSAIGGSLLILKFSREDELEADRLGVLYMTRLGYDPGEAITAHKNLEKVSDAYLTSMGGDPHERNFFEELLSTHPRTQIRLNEVGQIIASTPPSRKAGDGIGASYFRTMTADLRRVNSVYRDYYDKAVIAFRRGDLVECERYLNRAITAEKYQAPFYSLEGFVLLKRKDYYGAERYFNGALSLDRNHQPAIRGLGMIDYFRTNYGDAVRHLRLSLSLYPEDTGAHYFLGMSYYRTDRYREAIPHLSKVAESRPKHSKVHGVLGICYERENDLESAYKAYVKQVEIAPGNDMGGNARDRIRVLKPKIESIKKKS
ncbi:MAG TPA: M48 family metalloprotease [Thermodesulfovibrionales bacterium]|nr:M48 family metalloprotease [Thermodesulfovibrionales bacterium]